jgi:hypothetical protein
VTCPLGSLVSSCLASDRRPSEPGAIRCHVGRGAEQRTSDGLLDPHRAHGRWEYPARPGVAWDAAPHVDGIADPCRAMPTSPEPQGSDAIVCFAGGRAPARRSRQVGPAPSRETFVDAPNPGLERDRVFYRRPDARAPPQCLQGNPRWAQSWEIHRNSCQTAIDRRAPRSSILAQLGGVALLAEHDPRHPVIGDWSGRSTGGAACIMGGQPIGCLKTLRAPLPRSASRATVSSPLKPRP